MKHLFTLVASLFFTTFAFATGVTPFAGSVNAGVVGGSFAGSTSQSGAALVGVAATGGQTSTAQGAVAGGVVGPNGVTVYQFGGATGNSRTGSGALGLAAGTSQATGGSGNLTGAIGEYRTTGVRTNH